MYSVIEKWIDGVLTQKIPENVAAFSFNLYDDGGDNWSVELVGADRFDVNDEDWPCYEVCDFGTRDNPLEWSKKASWNDVLEEVSDILKKYLEQGKFADTLKKYKGVGVGFVDGDIEILYVK